MTAHEHEDGHQHDGHGHAPGHHGGHVHFDEMDWMALAEHTEREGEVLLAFVTKAAHRIEELRSTDAPPVRRILDIGSGPGVGTFALARMFPHAEVIAVDSSPAMLERLERRRATFGLPGRVSTLLAEMPAGLDGLEPVDVIWASMSLHHIGDEVTSLKVLGALLAPGGLIAVAEVGDAMRVLPDDLDVGRPGLLDRVDAATVEWFASMRQGLPDSVPSAALATMFEAAGLEVVDEQFVEERLEPPLSEDARRLAIDYVARLGRQLADFLDADDLAALDALADPDDERGVMHRSDVFVHASRRLAIGRAG